jgi:hypothetical protein
VQSAKTPIVKELEVKVYVSEDGVTPLAAVHSIVTELREAVLTDLSTLTRLLDWIEIVEEVKVLPPLLREQDVRGQSED